MVCLPAGQESEEGGAPVIQSCRRETQGGRCIEVKADYSPRDGPTTTERQYTIDTDACDIQVGCALLNEQKEKV